MTIMEKRKPHYDLNEVKVIVALRGMDAFTRTAKENSRLMGLEGSVALEVVLGLQREMLFRSMTTYADTTIWQDVYHTLCPNGKIAYIKVTLQVGAIVIQFKEK